MDTYCHVKARQPYPGYPERAAVPDECVDWSVTCDSYQPPTFTSTDALRHGDQILPDCFIKWNDVDGPIDRVSFMGSYEVDTVPLNPCGRTGLAGNGALWRYGPNKAADPIVTRFAFDSNGRVLMRDSLPVIEFVAIKRKDTGEIALPGGMVDPTDPDISRTLAREFSEEALNSLEMSAADRARTLEDVEDLFKNGVILYQGYVDDNRNTDNAWMETTVKLFHDAAGTATESFVLHAGDDAAAVFWQRYTPTMHDLRLFASHESFLVQAYAFALGKFRHWM